MNKAVRIILAIVVLLLVAGGSFFGGTLYGRSQAQATFITRRQGGFTGAPGAEGTPGVFFRGQQGQRVGQGGMLFGQIEQIGDGAMVIKDNNGRQTQVKVTDTTLIEKQASVKLTDLATGETVIVSGNTAADGSVTARSVQVAPAGRFGFGGEMAPGTPVP